MKIGVVLFFLLSTGLTVVNAQDVESRRPRFPPSSEYISATNGMAFLVMPSPLESFRVWDCFTTAVTFNLYEGLTGRELGQLAGSGFYPRRVLHERLAGTDGAVQNAINKARSAIARVHTMNEEAAAKRVYNQIFKIVAIIKKDQPASVTSGSSQGQASQAETLIDSMLVSKVVKDIDGSENLWMLVNARGLDSKVPMFHVACPEKGKFGVDQDAADKKAKAEVPKTVTQIPESRPLVNATTLPAPSGSKPSQK